MNKESLQTLIEESRLKNVVDNGSIKFSFESGSKVYIGTQKNKDGSKMFTNSSSITCLEQQLPETVIFLMIVTATKSAPSVSTAPCHSNIGNKCRYH